MPRVTARDKTAPSPAQLAEAARVLARCDRCAAERHLSRARARVKREETKRVAGILKRLVAKYFPDDMPKRRIAAELHAAARSHASRLAPLRSELLAELGEIDIGEARLRQLIENT